MYYFGKLIRTFMIIKAQALVILSLVKVIKNTKLRVFWEMLIMGIHGFLLEYFEIVGIITCETILYNSGMHVFAVKASPAAIVRNVL